MLKKLIGLLLIGFVIYYLLTSPSGAADAVGGILDAVITAFGQIGVFIQELVT